MEIKTEEYSITYETDTNTVICEGSLRLSGMDEYTPMVELLNNIVDSGANNITLNLRGLEFLNSSGINVLSKFVIKVRQQGNITMVVVGSNSVPWQGKSLKNLQKLMPSLQLVLE